MIEEKDVKAVALLELIDNIQRLGLGYHFKNNIKRALDRIVSFEQSDEGEDKSLHGTALRFRLLRQHGYDVSQVSHLLDVFKNFKDHNGNLNACLSNDVKGLLSLHETTYLAFEGETLLDEAKEFSFLNLKHHVGRINDSNLANQVNHSLDLPLQRRMVRLEAREYIEAYSKRYDANHVLLELAVVDFNMVQSKHQKELQDLTSAKKTKRQKQKYKSDRKKKVLNNLVRPSSKVKSIGTYASPPAIANLSLYTRSPTQRLEA
ncbi:isoprene synthase [Sarracenia purpurea var. burkii]